MVPPVAKMITLGFWAVAFIGSQQVANRTRNTFFIVKQV